MSGLGERRFSGMLTDEFHLWRLARPFMDEVHEVVRGAVTAFTERRDGPLRALDIGMGDGSITVLLLVDDKLAVTGVDNEPEMMERARKRLAEPLAGGRLEIVLDDALHYLEAVPSGAFDLIASGYALHNMAVDHRARVEDEIWRVLAPSGLFVNADKYAQAGEAHHRALRYQVNLFFDVLLPREKYGLLRQWVLHYVEDEAPDRLMPEAETVARLSELGFADLDIADRRYMDAVLVAHKP
jgi:ubiquinone/menaquinone biosynthesis C-methylase UbiE